MKWQEATISSAIKHKVYRQQYYIFIYYKFNQKLLPKIKFILGNNAVEPIGVKSNYFMSDLDTLK